MNTIPTFRELTAKKKNDKTGSFTYNKYGKQCFFNFFFFTLSIFSGDSETTSVQSALTYKLTVMTVIAVDPQIFDSQYY